MSALKLKRVFEKKVLRGLITSGSDTRQGKTSIARHGVRPFMGNFFDEVDFWGVEVEEHAQGVEDRLYKTSDIKVLAKDLRFARPSTPDGTKCVLVDLGGDLFRDLLDEMAQIDGGGLRFDFAIFPVTPVSSVAKFKTMLRDLAGAGLDPDQIFMVFNKIPRKWISDGSGFEGMLKNSKQIREIFEIASTLGLNISRDPIPENTIVPEIMDMEREVSESGASVISHPELASLAALVQSPHDYEALANEALDAGDDEAHEKWCQLMLWREYAARSARDYQSAMISTFSE